jgi:hypothetical protein
MKVSSRPFRVSSAQWVKREFNPSDKEDLTAYKNFLENSSWKNGCPFVVEWPFTDVISMIKHKIVERHIARLITQVK